MRNVKYRAWDSNDNRMLHVINMLWTAGDVLRELHENVPEGNWIPEAVTVILPNNKQRTYSYYPREGVGFKIYDIRCLSILEFVGLQDRVNECMYEGDIIKMYSGNLAQVKWSDDGIWNIGFVADVFKHIDNTNIIDTADVKTLRKELMRSEIIGNVYETPELLGV